MLIKKIHCCSLIPYAFFPDCSSTRSVLLALSWKILISLWHKHILVGVFDGLRGILDTRWRSSSKSDFGQGSLTCLWFRNTVSHSLFEDRWKCWGCVWSQSNSCCRCPSVAASPLLSLICRSLTWGRSAEGQLLPAHQRTGSLGFSTKR